MYIYIIINGWPKKNTLHKFTTNWIGFCIMKDEDEQCINEICVIWRWKLNNM